MDLPAIASADQALLSQALATAIFLGLAALLALQCINTVLFPGDHGHRRRDHDAAALIEPSPPRLPLAPSPSLSPSLSPPSPLLPRPRRLLLLPAPPSPDTPSPGDNHHDNGDDIDDDAGDNDDDAAGAPSALALEPLRVRDSVDALHFAIPHEFGAADTAVVLRFGVRLAVRRQDILEDLQGHVGEGSRQGEDEGAELERLRAREDTTRLTRAQRQQLALLVRSAQRRREKKAAEPVERQETQLIELHFHKSFSPAFDGRSIHLHVFRDGDVTAYRAGPTRVVNGEPHPHGIDHVVDLPEVVDLVRPAAAAAASTASTAIQPKRSVFALRTPGPGPGPGPRRLYHLNVSRSRLLELVLNSLLLVLAAVQLASLLVASPSWPLLFSSQSFRGGLPPRTAQEHFHARPHPLLSNLATLLETAAHAPQAVPFDVAELVDIASALPNNTFDISATPIVMMAFSSADAATPERPSIPVTRLFDEVRALLADLDDWLGRIAVPSTYKTSVELLIRQAEAASDAWGDVTNSFVTDWWSAAETMLDLLYVAARGGEMFNKPKHQYDAQLLSQLAKDPGQQDDGYTGMVSSVQESLVGLVASLDGMAEGMSKFGDSSCSRFFGPGREGGGQETTGTTATSTTAADAEADARGAPLFVRRANAVHPYLGCVLWGMGPVFGNLSATLQVSFADMTRLRRMLDKFNDEVRQLEAHLPAPELRFDGEGHDGASVVGSPRQDACWVHLESVTMALPTSPELGDSQLHFCVLYLPRAAAVHATAVAARNMIAETRTRVQARMQGAQDQTWAWRSASVGEGLPSYSWQVAWGGPFADPHWDDDGGNGDEWAGAADGPGPEELRQRLWKQIREKMGFNLNLRRREGR